VERDRAFQRGVLKCGAANRGESGMRKVQVVALVAIVTIAVGGYTYFSLFTGSTTPSKVFPLVQNLRFDQFATIK